MPGVTLKALYRFPVKSLRGIAETVLPIGPRGPLFDRHWMVVAPDGRFLTQRQLPRMALVDVQLDDQGRVQLAAPGMAALTVAEHGAERFAVTVWNDTLDGLAVDPAADAWLSGFLGQPCRLVRLPDDARRAVDPAYAAPDDQVGFADGFPLLLISQASLDHLNERLAEPVPMLRFRPNLVVEGCAAHAEDQWRRIRIGGLTFRVVKPCSRCPIPTVDIATGERGVEPLRTLMTYRRRDNRVYFGQNLLHDGVGELRVGMPVEVLE